MTPSGHEVTELLLRWSAGDPAALDRLIPLVYEQLRRLARRQVARERTTQTLQATALVNETYMRLIDKQGAVERPRALSCDLRPNDAANPGRLRTRSYELEAWWRSAADLSDRCAGGSSQRIHTAWQCERGRYPHEQSVRRNRHPRGFPDTA